MRLVLLGLMVIACGGAVVPVSGETCAAGTGPKCIAMDGGRSQSALFCEAGKWVEFACTGDLGCAPNYADAGVPFCHLPNLDAGSACPASSPASFGYCTPDRTAEFTCAASGVVVTRTCSEEGCTRRAEGQYLNERCLK